MPTIVQELYDLEAELLQAIKKEETPQQGYLESWCPRTSHTILTTLAKGVREHLFCKQCTAWILCTRAGG